MRCWNTIGGRILRPLNRTVIAIGLVIALTVPLVAMFASPSAVPLRASILGTLGGDPAMLVTDPPETAYVGQAYSFDAICTNPDNGATSWSLVTNASWLSIQSGGSGAIFAVLGGTPLSAGTYWSNLTVEDVDSYDYLNWTIAVYEQGKWGTLETFSELPTGTHDPYVADLLGGRLTLIDADASEESVILDGTLATFSRLSESNKLIATYDPDHVDDGLGWNMSVELYPTREESSYRMLLKPVPTLGMMVYIGNATQNLTAVALYVGDKSLGLERVSVLDATVDTWMNISNDIIPSFPNRHDNNPGGPQFSETIYGERPDHYTVSFRYVDGSSVCTVTVLHSSGVMVGSMDVPLPTPVPDDFMLRLVTDVATPSPSQWGYWMVDNICLRGLDSRYPVHGPEYEYITEGSPVWISVVDGDGKSVENAQVVIAGIPAAYTSFDQRYKAIINIAVGWSQPVRYSVTSDGVTITDDLLVTVMPDLYGQQVSLPLWWNGWAWVSVFGRDDSSSSTTANDTYLPYNHPKTSYVMSANPAGTSSDILYTQSEIALHFPHDYLMWPQRFWDEAVVASDIGHGSLENAPGYSYASRWDDPGYVGVGDMYITIACPGNSGSWEQLYAEYARGTRIMGYTSNHYNGAPGNASLIGSWYSQTIPPVYTDYRAPASQWYPYTPYDMMDTARGPNTDITLPSVEWQMTFWMAQNGGVRRVYNHGVVSPSANVLLSWIDNPKTNFSYENWKATDGEVASYVYGRWSTDVNFDAAKSNTTASVYDVTRADPISAGYWRVPITVAYNASGRQLSDIVIKEGALTLHKSDGSLRNVTGKRIMDVGYDIRGDNVYVSYFWNSSTELTFLFSDVGPEPNTPPAASFIADSYHDDLTKTFVFDGSTSTDLEDPLSALQFRWDWNGDGIWDTDWSSDPVAHHQFSAPGNYLVRLQVRDRGGLTGEEQANIEVTDVEVPEFQDMMLVVLPMVVLFVGVAYMSRFRRKR
jgi:hypothetical protein